MSEQTVNIPLLRKAVEWAEAEAVKPPELCEWDQSSYVAPSPSDRARFTASDWQSPEVADKWAERYWRETGKAEDCGTCFCVAGFIAYQVTGNLDYSKAAPIALDALGLRSSVVGEDYDDLFSPSNSIEDVRRIAETIAGERL